MSLSKIVQSLFLASAIGVCGCVQSIKLNINTDLVRYGENDTNAPPVYVNDETGKRRGVHLYSPYSKVNSVWVFPGSEKRKLIVEKDGKEQVFCLNENAYYQFAWKDNSDVVLGGPYIITPFPSADKEIVATMYDVLSSRIQYHIMKEFDATEKLSGKK